MISMANCLKSKLGFRITRCTVSYRWGRTAKGATKPMELKVYNDSVTAAETICDTKLELPLETEILIPDYLPQVFKIVKCFVSAVVLQKQVSTARLTLEGYLRLVVFYQSDTEESLCQTEQKVPFTKQVELRAGEYSGANVVVSGETEYVNCRAVNQRRVEIRGAYAMAVSVTAQTHNSIITALSECGIEQKPCTLAGVQTVAVQDKLMTADESIQFETPPAMILHIACAGQVEETKLAGGKAVLKGILHADITYRAAETKGLLHLRKELPFNEILEVPGADDGCGSLAFIEPTGCTVVANDDGTTGLSVTALLQIKVYRETEIIAVCDAFSTEYETQLTYGTVRMEKVLDTFSQQVEALAGGVLPDADATLMEVFTEVLPPELVQQDDGCVLRGHVLVHMLCSNALGEVDCYDKTCEYTLPKEYAAPRAELFAWANAFVVEAVGRKTGEDASVAVLVQVQGVITRQQSYTVLQQAVCADAYMRPESNVALRIYYAEDGEDIFDIARRYRVAVSALINANELTGTQVGQKTQLLIPS